MAGPGAFARRRGVYVVGSHPTSCFRLCVTASSPWPTKRGHPVGDAVVAAYRAPTQQAPEPPGLNAVGAGAVDGINPSGFHRRATDRTRPHGAGKRYGEGWAKVVQK